MIAKWQLNLNGQILVITNHHSKIKGRPGATKNLGDCTIYNAAKTSEKVMIKLTKKRLQHRKRWFKVDG